VNLAHSSEARVGVVPHPLPRSVASQSQARADVTNCSTVCRHRDSSLALDQGFDRIGDLAVAVRAHRELGLGRGVLVANPVPEEDEMPREIYEGLELW
jgi:hypothetical protein